MSVHRAASPQTGFYSPVPPARRAEHEEDHGWADLAGDEAQLMSGGESPRAGWADGDLPDEVDGEENDPNRAPTPGLMRGIEPEKPDKGKKGKKGKGIGKAKEFKVEAASNLYDDDQVEGPPCPMHPSQLLNPKMHKERDDYAGFLRREAAMKSEEVDYDGKRRQQTFMWNLINTKEKDRRLVLSRLRKTLAEGADIDELSEAGFTVAYTAASRGHADVLEVLIDQGGADCDQKSQLGVTPLMIANRRKRYACTEILCPPHMKWQGRDLIGRSLPEVVLRCSRDFDNHSTMSRKPAEELVVREGEIVVSANGPDFAQHGWRRVWRPSAPGTIGWVPIAHLERKPQTPPEAVPRVAHELPASARVMKLTQRDDIEALHLEQQNREPEAPDTPPQRAAHRSTMTTAADMQKRLEQAAKFASRNESYHQFKQEHFDEDGNRLAGAASPMLHGLTGEPPRKATAASRLKSLTVQQVTINQNSKLVHSAVAGVHALVDEHRRTDREEATWRVEDTVKREKTYADEMEEKAAKWAEEEEEWRIQQEEEAAARRLEEIAWEAELAEKREKARMALLDKKKELLFGPKTPEMVGDLTTQSFMAEVTDVMGLRGYVPPKTPDHVRQTRKQEEKVKKKLEAEVQRKYELEQAAKEEQKRLQEEARLLLGDSGGDGSRPGTRETSISRRSGSTLFQESDLKERWLNGILEAQRLQMEEVRTLMEKLLTDRGVVISLGLTDTPSDPVLNIPAAKGTGVAINLGLNADDQQMEEWRERLVWAEEGRAEVANETDDAGKIHQARMAGVMIETLLTQIKAAFAIGQRRKSTVGPYEKLVLETEDQQVKKQTRLLMLQDKQESARKAGSSSSSRPTSRPSPKAKSKAMKKKGKAKPTEAKQSSPGSRPGSRQSATNPDGDFPTWEDNDSDGSYGDSDWEFGDDDDHELNLTSEPYSVLMGRKLRTPSPPPTPPPPPTPSTFAPKYRVLVSQLIKAGSDPADSKLIGYTEEGEVIAALSTATMIIEKRVLQRVQLKFKKGEEYLLGWVSVKETKWNRMAEQEETTVMLELLPVEKPLPVVDQIDQFPNADASSRYGSTSAGGMTGATGSFDETTGSTTGDSYTTGSSRPGSRGGISTPGSKKKKKKPNKKKLSKEGTSGNTPPDGGGSDPKKSPKKKKKKKKKSSPKKKKGTKKEEEASNELTPQELAMATTQPVEVDEMHKDAKDRDWARLTPVEMRAVKLLGWAPLTWDEGSPEPMEKLFWGESALQGQARQLKPKEIAAAELLGYTEEIWDLGVGKGETKPSFLFGLMLHRRARNMKLWEWEQDALALGG